MSPAYGLRRIVQEMSATAIAAAVYGPDADPYYIEEKAAKVKRDFLGWVCDLDTTRMLRLDALIARASADELLR